MSLINRTAKEWTDEVFMRVYGQFPDNMGQEANKVAFVMQDVIEEILDRKTNPNKYDD